MRALRVAFLLKRPYAPNSVSRWPEVIRRLVDAGITVDVITSKRRMVDLSAIRVEHDLYVLKQISGLPLSIAGALHVQGAAIVNPYPTTVALCDKVVASAVLAAAGLPVPDTHAAERPELLAPLLEDGPIIVKPHDGSGGHDVRLVGAEKALAFPPKRRQILLGQRFHPPKGRDLKIYVIGARVLGVRKPFPARSEEEKCGEPFVPTPEQRDLALRCGEVFGIDLYGVDLIESDGRPWIVDMSSLPGFKGVPHAPRLLADYFHAAALRAARGKRRVEPKPIPPAERTSPSVAAGRTAGARRVVPHGAARTPGGTP